MDSLVANHLYDTILSVKVPSIQGYGGSSLVQFSAMGSQFGDPFGR
jgi:hypothetical protein